ncbi:MAG: single-stranded DNA-binding protein [Spiroplasma sp.]|nr:single-stranded DNA-binding protein [Spiroplasma sp.]
MVNNVIIVGRLETEPEIVPTKESLPAKWAKFIVAVERPFKNRQNEYEIDYITIKTWLANCQEIKELLKHGVIIAIKGRIQTFSNKNNDFHYTEIIADKLTYIN